MGVALAAATSSPTLLQSASRKSFVVLLFSVTSAAISSAKMVCGAGASVAADSSECGHCPAPTPAVLTTTSTAQGEIVAFPQPHYVVW